MIEKGKKTRKTERTLETFLSRKHDSCLAILVVFCESRSLIDRDDHDKNKEKILFEKPDVWMFAQNKIMAIVFICRFDVEITPESWEMDDETWVRSPMTVFLEID